MIAFAGVSASGAFPTMTDAAFLVGLLDCGLGACVSADDFTGPHGSALLQWQERGFVAAEPSVHPAPGCPHCWEGVPYQLGERTLCDHCYAAVDPCYLLIWALRAGDFFRWFAVEAGLHGDVQHLDAATWQLGTWTDAGGRTECFFRGPGSASQLGRDRLSAYRHVLVLFGRTRPQDALPPTARLLSLLDVLQQTDRLTVTPLATLLRPRGDVRFDAHSGALWLGDRLLGEVHPGTKEFFLLARLAAEIDHFVPYRELKREVLRQTGSEDATAEATFCQKLKNRIKSRYVAGIDELITATNKGDGYRLRGHVGI
jgi:hypothetical protein